MDRLAAISFASELRDLYILTSGSDLQTNTPVHHLMPDVYYNNDKTSFAYATSHERWPILVQNIAEDIQSRIETHQNDPELIAQGELLKGQINQLRSDILHDSPLQLFSAPEIDCLDSFDQILKSNSYTWQTGPWLFIECYLYRRVNLLCVEQSRFADYDVFNVQKRKTFEQSSVGVYELAIQYRHLSSQLGSSDDESLEALFREFADISLWGNATDLSLLTNATLEDIKSLQGKEAREKSEKNILCNDLSLAYKSLLSAAPLSRRIDFVLDNAGFELFTDLMLSLFVLDSKIASQVVLHCKCIPWMVSDTMVKDFQILVDDIANPDLFPEHRPEMDFLASQISKYHSEGKIVVKDSKFWTSYLDYENIHPDENVCGGSELYSDLRESSLVIFKGDLNYRKLTGDRQWQKTTPFSTAIGKLAHSRIKVLALRTCKADVCVGLPEGKDEELCQVWKNQGNENGKLWCSSGKWAVISYCDGR